MRWSFDIQICTSRQPEKEMRESLINYRSHPLLQSLSLGLKSVHERDKERDTQSDRGKFVSEGSRASHAHQKGLSLLSFKHFERKNADIKLQVGNFQANHIHQLSLWALNQTTTITERKNQVLHKFVWACDSPHDGTKKSYCTIKRKEVGSLIWKGGKIWHSLLQLCRKWAFLN